MLLNYFSLTVYSIIAHSGRNSIWLKRKLPPASGRGPLAIRPPPSDVAGPLQSHPTLRGAGLGGRRPPFAASWKPSSSASWRAPCRPTVPRWATCTVLPTLARSGAPHWLHRPRPLKSCYLSKHHRNFHRKISKTFGFDGENILAQSFSIERFLTIIIEMIGNRYNFFFKIFALSTHSHRPLRSQQRRGSAI